MKPDPADSSPPHSDTPETPAAGRNPYYPGIESCCSSHCYSSPLIHKSAECECRKFQIPPAPSTADRRRAHTQFPPAAQNSSLPAASSPPPPRPTSPPFPPSKTPPRPTPTPAPPSTAP